MIFQAGSRAIRRACVLVALAALAGGCGKKLTTVDSSLVAGVYPEGVRDSLEHSPSDLVIWPDVPNTVRDSTNHVDAYLAYLTGAGAMQGVVFDYSGATGYQIFRREVGGGFRRYDDFVHTPLRRWADHQIYGAAAGTLELPPAQLYPFWDAAPPAVNPNGYIGRALLAGLTSSSFPITNLGEGTPLSALDSMRYLGARTPDDSLLAMSWDAVPGAAGYWVHIFKKRTDINSSAEAVRVGLPAPVSVGQVKDLFIGYFPAPITAYKLGDPVPTGARILVYRVLIGLETVLIRVSAVDHDGRMIAMTTGPSSELDAYREKIGSIDRILVFSIGAVAVSPKRPLPTP